MSEKRAGNRPDDARGLPLIRRPDHPIPSTSIAARMRPDSGPGFKASPISSAAAAEQRKWGAGQLALTVLGGSYSVNTFTVAQPATSYGQLVSLSQLISKRPLNLRAVRSSHTYSDPRI